jgi:hypothetical protein
MHTNIIHMTFTYMPKEVYLKNVCRPSKIEFEWVSSCCLTPNNLLAISLARTIYIQWNDDDVRFVLD